MRKLITLFISIFVCLGVTACSNNVANLETKAEATKPSEEVVKKLLTEYVFNREDRRGDKDLAKLQNSPEIQDLRAEVAMSGFEWEEMRKNLLIPPHNPHIEIVNIRISKPAISDAPPEVKTDYFAKVFFKLAEPTKYNESYVATIEYYFDEKNKSIKNPTGFTVVLYDLQLKETDQPKPKPKQKGKGKSAKLTDELRKKLLTEYVFNREDERGDKEMLKLQSTSQAFIDGEMILLQVPKHKIEIIGVMKIKGKKDNGLMDESPKRDYVRFKVVEPKEYAKDYANEIAIHYYFDENNKSIKNPTGFTVVDTAPLIVEVEKRLFRVENKQSKQKSKQGSEK